MTALLDANVLIALVVADHVHHDAAADWLSASDAAFATCPITQGSLVRFLLRTGQPAAAAREVVSAVESAERHEFWLTVSLSLMCNLAASSVTDR